MDIKYNEKEYIEAARKFTYAMLDKDSYSLTVHEQLIEDLEGYDDPRAQLIVENSKEAVEKIKGWILNLKDTLNLLKKEHKKL